MASDFTITVKPKFGAAANRLKWMAKELNLKLKEAVSISALGAKANFKKTTRTWNTQPRFGIEVTRMKDSFSAEIGTNNLIYKWVEEGTRAHPIDAVNAPSLAFNTVFVAKTVPGRLSSRRGRSSGPIARPQHVDHPGTTAREFRVPILKRGKKQLRKEGKAAVKDVTERFGG